MLNPYRPDPGRGVKINASCRFVKYARPFVITTPGVKGLRN